MSAGGTTTRKIGLIVAVVVAAVAGVGVVVATQDGDDNGEIGAVRDATERFMSLDVAESADYGELADKDGLTCIEDPGGDGAMGTHFVNGDFVGDGVIDAERPEALLYDRSNGEDRLLGVEYVVLQGQWQGEEPPALFGHRFHLVDAPNRYGLDPFYELHAWVWEDNAAGMFNDWNPGIECAAATTEAGD